MGALFLLADPDFIPVCSNGFQHIQVEMEPNLNLTEGSGALAFNCPECGKVRYFDPHTARDITEEVI